MVSVITPTWGRHQLLLERCTPSVMVQGYRDVEHLVISDGPDPELRARTTQFPFRFEELPEHDDEQRTWGVLARRRGLELAQGELIAYLDDDNRWRHHHLELLVAALQESGADFAYSRFQVRHPSDHPSHVLGHEPPRLGQIDWSVIVHRRQLLELGQPELAGYACDWDLVDRWLEAEASYVFVPEVTCDYWLS